jgi:hypothetical protein
MRTEKNIVVAGGTAGMGSTAARNSPGKRSSWTVAPRLVYATAHNTAQTFLSNFMNLELMN